MHRLKTHMQDILLSIGKASKQLGVSIDTLRRWDVSGRLRSTRSGSRGHRYYLQSTLSEFLQDVEVLAQNWILNVNAMEPKSDMYCKTRDIFQARLETFQARLAPIVPASTVSLITAIAGEIGNNSFDHNLGNWPDLPGIFFSYSLRNRFVVLADRGLGILTTLQRARPQLSSSQEALNVAFTQTVSGRYPEARGNGLKFVRSIIVDNPYSLQFQTGDATLDLKKNDRGVIVKRTDTTMRGCFALIRFDSNV